MNVRFKFYCKSAVCIRGHTEMSEDYDESHLADVSGLPSHVRSGDE